MYCKVPNTQVLRLFIQIEAVSNTSFFAIFAVMPRRLLYSAIPLLYKKFPIFIGGIRARNYPISCANNTFDTPLDCQKYNKKQMGLLLLHLYCLNIKKCYIILVRKIIKAVYITVRQVRQIICWLLRLAITAQVLFSYQNGG